MQNLFLLGLDDFNEHELNSIRTSRPCRFVDLLGYDRVVKPTERGIDFDDLWREAHTQLDAFTGSVDGIASFWDFPGSALAAVLRNERGLPGPTNEAVAKCEHKYWSRLEQQAAVPALVPDFCAVDPFADDPLATIDLSYPFWIKPVKAHSSHLGFKIHNADELLSRLGQIRDGISLFGDPFEQFLRHVDVAEHVHAVDGHWCIAEAIISAGRQCTLEGYVYQGETTIYGVVDSIRSGKHRSCFARYQYPSSLPQRVQRRMVEAASKVMECIGYDDAPFNMEFYWNPKSDSIRLLKINARISKSHCPLFRMVDGRSNQQVMVDLALGRRPDFPPRQGSFRLSAKFMFRVHEDCIVRHMPDAEEIANVKKLFPEARIHLLARERVPLKHLHYQDSYSFELAEIFLGASSQRELLAKYDTCVNTLSFELERLGEAA